MDFFDVLEEVEFQLDSGDNVNDILVHQFDSDCYDYAEFYFNVMDKEFLLCTFKKLNTKTKSGKKARWILTD